MSENVQEKLSAKQKTVMLSLLQGSNKSTAAKSAGIHPRTISRWLQQPFFVSLLAVETEAALHDARRRLTFVMDKAIDAIDDALSMNTSRPAAAQVKLRAADMAISMGLKLIETSDLLRRLEAIEEKLI